MATKTNKKVRLTLAGFDGNAFNLLGKFTRAARKDGWTEAEIKRVTDDAKSGDYHHLLQVLSDVCEDEE